MLDAALFHARLKDFVQFQAVEYYLPGLPKRYTYVNADEATQTGIELSAEAYLGKGLAVMANYTYTDTDQENDLPGVTARHKGGVTVQVLHDKVMGSLSVVYSDRLVYDTTTPFYRAETIPAYTVVNGSVSYALLRDGRLSVGIRGTNLLDNRHREHIAGDIIERRVLLELKSRF
jgi:outer membrane receptor protein involved in Fe transport